MVTLDFVVLVVTSGRFSGWCSSWRISCHGSCSDSDEVPVQEVLVWQVQPLERVAPVHTDDHVVPNCCCSVRCTYIVCVCSHSVTNSVMFCLECTLSRRSGLQGTVVLLGLQCIHQVQEGTLYYCHVISPPPPPPPPPVSGSRGSLRTMGTTIIRI